MRWKNYGLIFTIADLSKISTSLSYSKSPQFLYLNEKPTFYFTSQYKDSVGKWISVPLAVQYDSDFSKVEDLHTNLLKDESKLGTFDEHGIFPFNPLKMGQEVWAYTTGWSRRHSVDIDMSIGLCKSVNGLKFDRVADGPIMSHNLREPFLVGDAFVIFENSTFKMWYIFGDNWVQQQNTTNAERRYRIAYAHSSDGMNWQRDGKYIIESKDGLECQALPSVVHHGDRYHMMFCYRNVFDFRLGGNNSYKLGYAYSFDSINWTRNDGFVSTISNRADWDASMQCYPNLFSYQDRLYCAYNGNDFGNRGFGLAELLTNKL